MKIVLFVLLLAAATPAFADGAPGTQSAPGGTAPGTTSAPGSVVVQAPAPGTQTAPGSGTQAPGTTPNFGSVYK